MKIYMTKYTLYTFNFRVLRLRGSVARAGRGLFVLRCTFELPAAFVQQLPSSVLD
jgi:hypothetical protein